MTTILLHGLGQGPQSWDAAARALEGETLQPGLFALTAGGPVTYPALYRAFEAYCALLAGPVRLCGLSLGGVLALQYAARHPERTEALTLIGTPLDMPRTLLRLQNLAFRLAPQRVFQSMGLSKADITDLTTSMLDLDLRAELGKIACPALVLCGERDRANRRAAQALQKGLPRAELAWVPGAGHEVNADAPAELSKIINDFYNRIK